MKVTITKASIPGYGWGGFGMVTLEVSILAGWQRAFLWFLSFTRCRVNVLAHSWAEKITVNGYGHSWIRHDGKPVNKATNKAISAAWKAWASAHSVDML